MKAEILKVEGDILTVKLHSPLDVETLSNNKYNDRSFIYIDPWLKGTTTDQQRKHFFALMNDISDYTGELMLKAKVKLTYLFAVAYDLDDLPSLARNKMKKELASKLIQFVIDYCLDNDIPLQNNYLDEMTSKQLFKMLMKRQCWICGKHADVAHYEAVGMGRDRKSIDHTQHKFMSLCRKHHQEQHNIGVKTFCELYKIEPIKLSKENLKELGVM